MRIITGILSMVAAGAVCTCALAASSLATGFEPPNFTTGGLHGQQGWSVSGGGTQANVVVSNAHPDTGAQHIRMTGGASSPPAVTGTTSPQLDIFGTTPTTTSFRLAIQGVDPTNEMTQGATYIIQLSSFATGKSTAEMDLNFDGHILVDAGGPTLTDTGKTWSPSAIYDTYTITVDASASPADHRVIFSRNGIELAHTGLQPSGPTSGGTTVDRFQFFSDNFQQPAETADIDNFSMTTVPEPALAGLISVLALSMARWSRGRRVGRSCTPVS